MASDTVEIGQSVQALYHNIEVGARRGFGHEEGAAASIDSGTLGQPDTLSVSAGSVVFGSSATTVATQPVGVDPANPNEPRKDVVYVDGSGVAQVAKGTPNTPPDEQLNAERFDYYTPSPPSLADTEAVVVAEVWVPAGATSIIAPDLADRRVFETRPVIRATSTETLTGGSDPALEATLDGVTTDQGEYIRVDVTPDSAAGFTEDYAYNVDTSRAYDASAGAVDITVVATWDTDPGGGNDVSVAVRAVTEGL